MGQNMSYVKKIIDEGISKTSIKKYLVAIQEEI